jgi:hypothetical protein
MDSSLRRERLDHVIVFSEDHLRRVLDSYFAYYHGSRTHLSLDRNAPTPRRLGFGIEQVPKPLDHARSAG